MNKESGYVYILTRSTSGRLHTCKNPSFREDWVKIGKSENTVSRWCANKVQPSISHLNEIATISDVDVKDLLNSNKLLL